MERGTQRESDREPVTSRIVGGPPQRVFEAWTNPEQFRQWWVPKSAPITLVSCEMDVRTGGQYRLVFSADGQTAEFFGRYLEVTPCTRIVWTNDEGGVDAANITTVSFEVADGSTRVIVRDLYPSKAALDDAVASGSSDAMPEQLAQLDRFIRAPQWRRR